MHNLELDTIMRNVQQMDTEWEDMLDVAIDREEWRNCTIRCALHWTDYGIYRAY